jgi:tetratricopeptide (TPR) repeat protein
MDVNDYTDPICPFDLSQWQKDAPAESVPMDRIIAKEDEYLGRNDYAGAERHLLYWLADAKAGNDFRGAFQIENELMGLYRKSGREKEARAHAEAALQMAEDPRIGSDSTGAATCYINAATVCKTFGRADEGIALFEKARVIYERDLPATDGRLGGLYNNMALALTDLGRAEEALGLYDKALARMEQIPGSEPEIAITCLNICDTLMARDARIENEAGEPVSADDPDACLVVPPETDRLIDGYLDRAFALLQAEKVPHDGYYAFVCEKCAPSFAYYGQEKRAQELRERSEAIYRKNQEK